MCPRLEVCTVERRGWFAPDTFPYLKVHGSVYKKSGACTQNPGTAGSITRELEVLFTKLKTEGVSGLSNCQIADGQPGLDR
jgi:hypothetical protein